MSGQETKGGVEFGKWAWAHRKGLALGATGVMGTVGAVFAYRRWHRGEDGLRGAERSALKHAHADFIGNTATKAGLAPQSIKLNELGRAMPLEGKVVVGVTSKRMLADQASRTGGQIAAGFRLGEGEDVPWQAVAVEQDALGDMGKNALNFEEVGIGFHVPADAQEVAIGLKWGEGKKELFLPVETSFRTDGSPWDIAVEYPKLPIIGPTVPGSAA